MKHETTIIAIKTDEPTNLYLCSNGELKFTRNTGTCTSFLFYIYLYATVTRELEPVEDCWYYDSTNNSVEYCKKGHGWGKDVNLSQYSKIIATTDTKLALSYPKITDKDSWWCGKNPTIRFVSSLDAVKHYNCYNVPDLQASFLKEFATYPDRLYKVECENIHDNPERFKLEAKSSPDWSYWTNVKVKLVANSVNITSVEPVYTEEEVLAIVKKAFVDFRHKNKSVQYVVGGGNANVNGKKKTFSVTNLKHWIIANLK